MIQIIVDVETIKKACENYRLIHRYINKLYRNKLEEYKCTKVKRKLFGFNIPWTQTTRYKQLGLDSYFTGDYYGALSAKLCVMRQVIKEMLEAQQDSGDPIINDWLFMDMELDVLGYTERYEIYYTLSKLVYSDIQQVTVGFNEYTFINYWITQDNLG